MDFLQFDTVSSTYSWLVYSGGLALILSYILGKIPAWKNWKGSPSVKEHFFNAGIVGLTSWVVSIYESASPELLLQLEGAWPIVTGIVAIILSIKKYYISQKK